MHTYVDCSPIYNSQDLETILVPLADECLRKWKYIYLYAIYYYAINKRKKA